jgi:hypothetical protein
MTDALLDNLNRIWITFHAKVLELLPRLLAALAVFLAGLLLGALLRAIVRRGLKLASFDRRFERSGLSLPLRRTRLGWSPTEMAGGTAFWGTALSAGIFSLNALEIPLLDHMVEAFFLYLPKVFVAGIVLAAGFLLANFLYRAALLLAVNEELPSPRLLAAALRLLVNLLAFAMAMEQLGVAQTTVTVAFAILFGSFMLALALAFGLGGRDLARDFLARRLAQRGPDREEGLKHL